MLILVCLLTECLLAIGVLNLSDLVCYQIAIILILSTQIDRFLGLVLLQLLMENNHKYCYWNITSHLVRRVYNLPILRKSIFLSAIPNCLHQNARNLILLKNLRSWGKNIMADGIYSYFTSRTRGAMVSSKSFHCTHKVGFNLKI